jgi:hypothetical protein
MYYLVLPHAGGPVQFCCLLSVCQSTVRLVISILADPILQSWYKDCSLMRLNVCSLRTKRTSISMLLFSIDSARV